MPKNTLTISICEIKKTWSKNEDKTSSKFLLLDILTKNFLQKKLFNEFYMFRSSKNLSKNKKHVNFTSFNILNTKYDKHKINSKLSSDKLTIYKNWNV